MARQRTPPAPSGYTVLVVDDNQEYLVAAERILHRCGHSVVAMENPVEALALLRKTRFDLVLVDFFMPQMTGEAFVAQLRSWNPLIQVILQTGYASEMPPRELVRRLDIQGYYDKSEGPDKLLLWVDVGLKGARIVRQLDRERSAQRAILEAAMELHRGAPAADLFPAIVAWSTGLFQVLASFRAPEGPESDRTPDVLVVTSAAGGDLTVRAGAGRYTEAAASAAASVLGDEALSGLRAAMSDGSVQSGSWGAAVPLALGGSSLGALYLDRPLGDAAEKTLFRAFADHAALAVHRLGEGEGAPRPGQSAAR